MKTTIISCFFLVLATIVYSQPEFSYTYDAAGNRTLRTRNPPKMGANSKDKSSEYFQTIDNHAITALPNPTQGNLNVKITNLEKDQNAEIRVFDENGILLKEMKNARSISPIDIIDKPTGTYIIVVYIGKEKREWKVIKVE